MSTAYHPQTDGQSEHANQWVEQYLHIYGNEQQDDWATLLPMAQFIHNLWPNASTGFSPFELIMGHMPRLHIGTKDTALPELNKRKEWLKHLRERAQDMIERAQRLVQAHHGHKKGQRTYVLFKEGDRVWLEGTNL